MTLTTVERILLLGSAELFCELSREDLAPLARRARELHIGRGETFIRRGEQGQCLFVIVDGEAEIKAPGREIARRGNGDVIGEMAIIWRRPRSADCTALTDLTALQIDHDDFWAMLAERPALAQGIIKVLAARLDELDAAAMAGQSQ